MTVLKKCQHLFPESAPLFSYQSDVRGTYGLTVCSIVGHIVIAPGFKPQPGYVRRMFHLSLHFIYKIGHKTAAFTFDQM